jgi:hypothetical protein
MSTGGPVNVAIMYVERMNRRDFAGMLELAAADFRSVNERGEVSPGREENVVGFCKYVAQNPDFQIHIADIYVSGDTVTIAGRPSGSCAGPSKDVEIRRTHLYVCVVRDGLVAEFRHRDDTDEERHALGVSAEARITE